MEFHRETNKNKQTKNTLFSIRSPTSPQRSELPLLFKRIKKTSLLARHILKGIGLLSCRLSSAE